MGLGARWHRADGPRLGLRRLDVHPFYTAQRTGAKGTILP